MINLVFLTEEYRQDGSFPPALTMVVVFQALYVADALWFEVRCALVSSLYQSEEYIYRISHVL
jgi:hypothetical protein